MFAQRPRNKQKRDRLRMIFEESKFDLMCFQGSTVEFAHPCDESFYQNAPTAPKLGHWSHDVIPSQPAPACVATPKLSPRIDEASSAKRARLQKFRRDTYDPVLKLYYYKRNGMDPRPRNAGPAKVFWDFVGIYGGMGVTKQS